MPLQLASHEHSGLGSQAMLCFVFADCSHARGPLAWLQSPEAVLFVERPVPGPPSERGESHCRMTLGLGPQTDLVEQEGPEPSPAARRQDIHLFNMRRPVSDLGDHHANG